MSCPRVFQLGVLSQSSADVATSRVWGLVCISSRGPLTDSLTGPECVISPGQWDTLTHVVRWVGGC